MRLRFPRIWGYIILIIVLIHAVGLAWGCSAKESSSNWEIAEVKRGNLVISVNASGNLKMPHQVNLAFEIGGKVKKVYVELGDKVKKGQKLAELDSSSLERAVERARANLDNAWLNLLRAGPDARSQEAAQNQVKLAEVALNEALDQLKKATLFAPFDGVIAEVKIKEGDLVSPGANLISPGAVAFLLVDPSKVEMTAWIDEVDIARVKCGQKAIITLDALPGTQLTGKVVAISPAGRSKEGVITYQTKIEIEGNTEGVKGEMTGLAQIIVEEKKDVLLVPNQAIKFEGGKSIVKVISNGKPQEREIEIGVQGEEWTEVIKGLKEGDKVIVESVKRLERGGFLE